MFVSFETRPVKRSIVSMQHDDLNPKVIVRRQLSTASVPQKTKKAAQDCESFARDLSDNRLIRMVNVSIERRKLLPKLFGSCYNDILSGRDIPVCKACQIDDKEDCLGCKRSGEFFHAGCLGVNFATALQDPFFYWP
ncbi:hypothetical protein AWC38_SpisGene3499 [Stylophora pistillata]|uniref:Uncharacterized protein n=1 Tax=Stylophora pistillata TaxID=50429 RepID=A0A2B4SSY0_STYPI|nr:hypothetical protein AWC38_SpisGene3499 [Stylophora pistillata]